MLTACPTTPLAPYQKNTKQPNEEFENLISKSVAQKKTRAN